MITDDELPPDDIEVYTKRFWDRAGGRLVLATDDVRRLPEWSTVAHRALENRVGLLDHLGARLAEPLPDTERRVRR